MHLTKFGIENIRVFKNKQDIKLAPITVLTGPNNSGKSTFTKTLLLLKDTFSQFSTRNKFNPRFSTGKVDYNYFDKHVFPHRLVFDGLSSHSLGSFSSIISNKSRNQQITFQLPFLFPEIIEDNEGVIEFTYKKNNRDNELESVRILIGDKLIYSAEFKYEENKIVNQKTLFNIVFLENLYRDKLIHLRNEEPLEFTVSSLYEFSCYSGLAHELTFASSFDDFSKYYYPFVAETKDLPERYFELLKIEDDKLKPEFFNELLELENGLVESSLSKEGFLQIETPQDSQLSSGSETLISQFNRSFSYHLLSHFINKKNITHMYVGKYDETYEQYVDKFGELEWFNYNPSAKTTLLLGMIDRSISYNLENYSRIFSQCNLLSITDVGFDELITRKDERLFNLLNQFGKIQEFEEQQQENQQHYRVQSFISESLNKLNMGKEIIVNNVQNYGLEIKLDTGRGPIPVKDQGYGIRKLLSLVLSISSQAHNNQFELSFNRDEKKDQVVFYPNLIILEEPEANLHPAFQSILADILVLAAKWFNMQFITETHSEYLIRKLQYLTATDNHIKAGDIAVYYFHENAEQKAPLYIEIGKDGSLSDDFGPGFYDEAIRTKFDLMRLKNGGRN